MIFAVDLHNAVLGCLDQMVRWLACMINGAKKEEKKEKKKKEKKKKRGRGAVSGVYSLLESEIQLELH